MYSELYWGLFWFAFQGQSHLPSILLSTGNPFPPAGWPAGCKELGASQATPRNATGISNVPFGALSFSNLLHH